MINYRVIIILALIISLPAFCITQADVKPTTVGGKLGLVFPDNAIMSNVAISLEGNWRLTVPNTRLALSTEYWRSHEKPSEPRQKIYLLGVYASLINEIFINNYTVTPYYGGGVGLQFHESKFADAAHFQQDFDLALNAVVGANFLLTETVMGIAEAKYHFAGHVDYFVVWLGIQYILP